MENNTIWAVIYNHIIKVIGTEITVNKSGETIGEGGGEREKERERGLFHEEMLQYIDTL